MSKKILLLGEDEKDVSEMYKIAFEKAGFKVLTAFDGEEVIKMAKKEIPDVVLLDINMPKKDGFEVLQDISEDPVLYRAFGRIPVIMLTNYSNTQDIDYCMKMGAQDYIVKVEWTPEKVVKKVESYLKEMES